MYVQSSPKLTLYEIEGSKIKVLNPLNPDGIYSNFVSLKISEYSLRDFTYVTKAS
jgi:hypothetical protein